MIRVDDSARSGVRLITFDRPEARNAFNSEMYAAATDALIEARADDAVKVVVITGAGKAFCAGQDLAELAVIAEQHANGGAAPSGFPAMLDALTALDKPLIAAVNGPAVGLGFTMLPHADIVVVGESARLRVPFAEFGVPPEAASSYLFPQRLGWQRAAAILLTGDWVSARQAVDWGFALDVVVDEQLLDHCLDLAARIASAATESLRGIKRSMQAWQRPLIDAALTQEADGYASQLSAQTAATIRASGPA